MKIDATLLPDAVIYELNATLKAQGKRICRICQGHPLPLDREHFYCHKGYFARTCKRCDSAREAKRARARYANGDAEFIAHYRAVKRAWRAANPDKRRASWRAGHKRKKARKLAAVLGKRP